MMERNSNLHNDQSHKQAIVIERVLDAPREQVWKTWTEPEFVKRWWGPKDFTSPFVQIDLRDGGKTLSCMRSPEGDDYWSTGVFLKVNYPNQIVSTDSFADKNGNIVPASTNGMGNDIPLELVVTTTFEELSQDQTRLTLKHEGMPAGENSELARAGWEESFDKLEKLLKEIR